MCWLHVTVFRICSVRSEPSFRRPGPDSDSYSLWTRYGDLKTDLWDDPYISIGSCSEDQTAIRFRNRVISCECSFMCIYCCQYAFIVALIILCDFLLYFTSLISFTTSWDIYNCLLYLRSWYQLISVLFHVLVVWSCWLRPSFNIPLDCDLTRSIDWID